MSTIAARHGSNSDTSGTDNITVFDGLVAAKWGPDVFQALRAGAVTAINATCAVWEDASQTLNNLSRWLAVFDAYSHLIAPIHRVSDIGVARATGRTGIVLGFQNGSPLGDRLDYIALYKQLGVRIIQLTYNTQNLIGCGCYESRDSGLSDFGRDVVEELNRVGIAIDLSHVGTRTSDDAMSVSKDPVAFSHVLPKDLKDHPRNKETEQLRAVANGGGVIGVTMVPDFLPSGGAATVDDFAELIDWMVNVCGEDHVGYSTDFAQDQTEAWWEWISRDKGYGRWLTPPPDTRNPTGLERIEETPNLIAALKRRSWPTSRIEKIMGLNWVSYFGRVWQE